MNVSSLTPWMLDFHSSIFCQFWLFFVFKFVVVLLLVVRGGTVCLPKPPSLPEVQIHIHLKELKYTIYFLDIKKSIKKWQFKPEVQLHGLF